MLKVAVVLVVGVVVGFVAGVALTLYFLPEILSLVSSVEEVKQEDLSQKIQQSILGGPPLIDPWGLQCRVAKSFGYTVSWCTKK